MAYTGEIKTIIPGVSWKRETAVSATERVDKATFRAETAIYSHQSAMTRMHSASQGDVSAAVAMESGAFTARANAVNSGDLNSSRLWHLHFGSFRVPLVPDLRQLSPKPQIHEVFDATGVVEPELDVAFWEDRATEIRREEPGE